MSHTLTLVNYVHARTATLWFLITNFNDIMSPALKIKTNKTIIFNENSLLYFCTAIEF